MPPEITHCVDAALDKKAEDVVVLDLRNISDVTDFFVICHATSDRQALTIADHVEERLARDLGVKPKSIEGRRRGEWILMDYIDFVVHVFTRDKRSFYGLEKLWADAPRLDIAPAGSTGGTKRSRPARR